MVKFIEDRASSNCQAYYALVMFTILTAVNQLHRYLLLAAIEPMANDLEFGDKECELGNVTAADAFIEAFNLDVNRTDLCLTDDGIFCTNQTSFDNATLCEWHYTGTGLDYQILAGPAFIIVLGLCGVPLTVLAEMGHVHRRNVVAICTVLWSCTIILTGLATSLAEIYVWRFLLGFFEAPYNPFSISILTSLFSPAHRGIVISLVSSGSYIGYGLSYALISVVDAVGWRATYIGTGIVGALLGILTLLTVANPKHVPLDGSKSKWVELGSLGDIWRLMGAEPWSVLVPIFLAFACKMGYQYTLSYNLNPYFQEYYPDFRTDIYLSWLLAGAGFLAYIVGGVLGDAGGKMKGPSGRLAVIILLEAVQIPLYIVFFTLDIPANLIVAAICIIAGDGWLGIGLSAIADFVTPSLRTIMFALLFCTMDVLGGCVTVAVAPIADSIGLSSAILWLGTGMLLGGTALIALSILAMVLHRLRRPREAEVAEDSEKDGLLTSRDVDASSSLLGNDASTSYTHL